MPNTLESYLPEKDARSNGVTLRLHNETLTLRPGAVLYDPDTARQQEGINGAVLAIIILPRPLAGLGEAGKRIALVDFGEVHPAGGSRAVLYDSEAGRGYPYIRARERFGLIGINYQLETGNRQLPALVQLPVGSEVTIGRIDNAINSHNHNLGLTKRGNDTLSRDHVTIDVIRPEEISITDHSRNATYVTVPDFIYQPTQQ